MTMFSTIVVAIDFSEMSRDVLRYAVRLADASPGAKLLVMHVVPDPLQQPWTAEAIGMDFVQVQKDWMSEAAGRLERLLANEGLMPGAFVPVVRAGRPADEIVRLASDRKADLVVVGTHGYGPVKHLVLGSVAERVLRRAACPVITVPHKSLETLARQAAIQASEAEKKLDVEC
jgi:nucleotide-binding universal stress UspA family protein